MVTATSTTHFSKRGRDLLYRIPLYLLIVLGAFVFFVPFYWMVRTAIMPAWQIYKFPPEWIPAELHLETFKTPFKVYPFEKWFLNTVIIAGACTVGTAFSSACVGFSFARLRTPGRDVLFVIVLATMMLPQQVRLIPAYLLYSKLGWVNTWAPLIVPSFLAPAYFVFLTRQFFMTIPKEMDDAAMIDGCNPARLFFRIHLPMSGAALGVVAIFQFQSSWNDFMGPLIYLQKYKTFPLSLGLRLFQGKLQTDMRALMAASLMSVAPLLILFFIAQRYFIQGIVVSGIKG